MSVDNTKQRRSANRSSFTRTLNKLDALMAEEAFDLLEMDVTLESLTEKAQQLRLLDEAVLTALQETGVDQTQYDAEFNTAEEYQEKWISARTRVRHLHSLREHHAGRLSTSSAAPASVSRSPHLQRLPEFEITKYDGDPRQWITFWSQFKKIHEDDHLDPSYKFQLLLQSTKENSKPREIVSSFPGSSENYETAVNYLKERFGQDSVLIQVYIRDILQLVIANKTGNMDLCTLYDKLQTHLRALESLGVTKNNFAHFLYPLVESALPTELIRAWERNRGKVNAAGDNGKSDLECLIEFLKIEVESEMRIKIARESFNEPKLNCGAVKKQNKKFEFNRKSTPVAHELLTANDKISYDNSYKNNKTDLCIFCDKPHASENCNETSSMSLEAKKHVVRQKKACFICLRRSHFSDRCRSKHKCLICKQRHFVILCPDLPVKNQVQNLCDNTDNDVDRTSTLNNQVQFSDVLLQTLVVKIHNGQREMLIRCILDSGSMRSYISDDIMKIMQFRPLSQVKLKQSLFGGIVTKEKVYENFHVEISNVDSSYKCRIPVLNQPRICSLINRVSSSSILKECKALNINLSDFTAHGNVNPEIKLLIGADVFGKLLTGDVVSLKSGPTAIKTLLGWTLMGKCCLEKDGVGESVDSNKKGHMAIESLAAQTISTSLLVKDSSISNLWKLDVLGIIDPAQIKSINELREETENHFLSNLRLDNEGRYETALPWVLDKSRLTPNLKMAEKCALSTKKKLIAKDKIETYSAVFDEWLSLGIIERVTDNKVTGVHYLPHRPIFKDNAQTKTRPVFNASFKKNDFLSLNDCLATGPNLIEEIPSILNRFREYKVATSSDIEKAYCSVGIQEVDRDFLRFVWYDNDNFDELITYRHKRVVFGVTCSPYLLAATLRYHLSNVSENLRETANILKSSFYVDNCLTSLNSETDMERFIEQSRTIMSKGHFNLRGWQTNVPLSILDTSSNETDVPVLGLVWSTINDTLSCKIDKVTEFDEPITKRAVLATAHQVFDVIGFTAPVLLLPKIILQKTWELKIKWDDVLPDDLIKQFKTWRTQLHLLTSIKIPRWLNIEPGNEQMSVHLFCDASQSAYGACIFLRVEQNETVRVNLMSARSRVAPLKLTTIPRLELLACCIGARLLSTTLNDMHLSDVKIYCWTDSTTVLCWIRRNQNWGIFVQNRVKEIQSLISPLAWNHVPGIDNPADLASRGCSAEQFLERRWWEGPDWLYQSEENWPKSDETPDENLVNTEKRKTVITNLSKSVADSDWYYKHFSSYKKIVRMIAWILRFCYNTRNVKNKSTECLSVNEIEKAEIALILLIQKESFEGVKDERLSKLRPFVDNNGLIRVKTNIACRDDTNDFKFPIVLPSKHPVVKLLIINAHHDLLHGGTSILMSHLREKYWILKSRKTIKNCIASCIKCQWFKAKKCDAAPGVLPNDRVRDAAIFEVVGCDLAGPLYLKGGKKAYIVLYTCAVYRAVHLELITSLSTEVFFQSLRRFVARRGRPTTIYSDNATNFVGAQRVLNSIDWNYLCSKAAEQKIHWKFNPPSAPWWGGWWERLIQVVKQILRKILGRASLDYEELLTVLCDCERVINSRPLTYVSQDVEDLSPLTPEMFLREIKESGVPDIDNVDKDKLSKRAQYLQKMRNLLRIRFRSEYLGQLRQQSVRKFKSKPLTVGEVVLLEDNNKKRAFWNLARVVKLIPGRDGHIRLAVVKTETTEFLRPVQRLYRLEMESPINVEDDKPFPITTSSGRIVKTPVLF